MSSAQVDSKARRGPRACDPRPFRPDRVKAVRLLLVKQKVSSRRAPRSALSLPLVRAASGYRYRFQPHPFRYSILLRVLDISNVSRLRAEAGAVNPSPSGLPIGSPRLGNFMIRQARLILARCMNDYNTNRPHS